MKCPKQIKQVRFDVCDTHIFLLIFLSVNIGIQIYNHKRTEILLRCTISTWYHISNTVYFCFRSRCMQNRRLSIKKFHINSNKWKINKNIDWTIYADKFPSVGWKLCYAFFLLLFICFDFDLFCMLWKDNLHRNTLKNSIFVNQWSWLNTKWIETNTDKEKTIQK